jgi:hypothetical protein
MQSNKDHAVYSDSFSSKRQFKPEGYHTVCVQYVALSCYLSAKQMTIGDQGAGRLVGLLSQCRALCHLNLDDIQIGHEGAGRSTDTVPSVVLPESFFERDLSEHNRQTQRRMEWGTNSPRDVNFILQWSLYRGGKNGTSLKFFLFKINKKCCIYNGSF